MIEAVQGLTIEIKVTIPCLHELPVWSREERTADMGMNMMYSRRKLRTEPRLTPIKW